MLFPDACERVGSADIDQPTVWPSRSAPSWQFVNTTPTYANRVKTEDLPAAELPNYHQLFPGGFRRDVTSIQGYISRNAENP
jgi:hypothetical protein